MFILFINNKTQGSAVYERGKKIFNILNKTENTLYIYKEIETCEEFNTLINDIEIFIDFIIYNYEIETMGWLNNLTINKKIFNLGIIYNENKEMNVTFDKIYNVENILDRIYNDDDIIINDFINIIYSNDNNIDNNIRLDKYKIDKSCYILLHGGFGDIIYNCGIINFLSHFYDKLYIFCPQQHTDKINTIFSNINISIINYDKWYKEDSHIFWENGINTGIFNYLTDDLYDCAVNYLSKELTNNYDNFDWENYVKIYPDLSKINNKDDALHHWINFGINEGRICFMKETKIDVFSTGKAFQPQLINMFVSSEKINKYNNFKFYTKISHPHIVDYFLNFNGKKMLYNNIWDMMPEFGSHNPDIRLDIYYNYFNIPITKKSIEIYETIKNYKLVFMHFVSSAGKLEIPFGDFSHIKNEDYLIIDPDKNHYEPTNQKYGLVEQLLNLNSLDYLSIILNATDIYVVDSSFYAIIYGLRVTNKLNSENIIIYDRFYLNKKCKYFRPVNISKSKSLKQQLEWIHP